jgi:hypothetical protein
MDIPWHERASLSWTEHGKVRGRSMPIGEAVDLYATFSDEQKRRAEIFLLKPIEIAPNAEILCREEIERLLVYR